MANWHYYTANNEEKIGPVTGKELKQLVQQGTITPQTFVEDPTGRTGLAKDVNGLTFPELTLTVETPSAENPSTVAPFPIEQPVQVPPVAPPPVSQSSNLIPEAKRVTQSVMSSPHIDNIKKLPKPVLIGGIAVIGILCLMLFSLCVFSFEDIVLFIWLLVCVSLPAIAIVSLVGFLVRLAMKNEAQRKAQLAASIQEPTDGQFVNVLASDNASDSMYCRSCGNVVKKAAEICPKCGVRTGTGDGRSWVVTLLLCLFLGGLGIHRFYTGSTVIGIIQLLTMGCCGIWTFIDLILILVGAYKTSDGKPLGK
jgi:hypothetical protein